MKEGREFDYSDYRLLWQHIVLDQRNKIIVEIE